MDKKAAILAIYHISCNMVSEWNRRVIDLEKLELSDREKELLLLSDTSPSIICSIDLDCRYRRVNKTFENRFGLSTRDVHGRLVREVLGDKDWSILQTYISRVLAGEKVAFEQQLLLGKSDRRWMKTMLTPDIDGRGKIQGFVVHALDITEQKKAQEALKKREEELKASEEEIRKLNASLSQRASELETANKELEGFTHSVSHDLRAPLRQMNIFSKLMLKDYADKLDEMGKEYLQYIQSSSEHVAQLMEDLLNFSRIGQAAIKQEKVDLSELANQISKELTISQPERVVEWKITPGLSASCDTQLLKLVLENLLGNAFKFTGKRPKAIIEFGITNHGNPHEFFVRDNGVGFDMKFADKLFKPFQRLHSSQEFPGTGIGLASVHRIVTRLGGTIRAESELNKGTTFYFTIQTLNQTQ